MTPPRSRRTRVSTPPADAPPDSVSPDLVAIAPHQDDEVLSMGPAILEAVSAGMVVTVLLISRGEASIVRSRDLPRKLGFVPSPHHFSALRDREFDGAVRAMGATPVIPPYEERLADSSATPEAVAALIRGHVARGTTAWTISAYDGHPDHRACGRAVQALIVDGYLSQAAYFISPERLDLIPGDVALDRVGAGTPITRKHQHPYRSRRLARNWWGSAGEVSGCPSTTSCDVTRLPTVTADISEGWQGA
ncbi:PIG-L deacetylase family protein [Ornithinimicrobium ciconiae]|nr:PIG-L family deacetylase [Ornithinimicrobium ciconiae]